MSVEQPPTLKKSSQKAAFLYIDILSYRYYFTRIPGLAPS